MVDVGWLAETGPCKMFKAGQNIPCPDNPDSSERSMYILIVGKVEIYKVNGKGATELWGELLPGGVFGGGEFFTNIAENIYIAAIDSVVYILSENSFNDLSWAQPSILFEVLKAAYTPLKKISVPPKKEPVKTSQGTPPKSKEADPQKNAVKMKAIGKPKDAAAPEVRGAMPVAQPVIITGKDIFLVGHKSYPAITKPEYERLIYPKDYSCPFCKKEFMDYRVFRSKLYESAPVRFDLRRYYTDFQTEWYDIITCRHCYFSMLHNYFTEPKPVLKAKIEDGLTAARASVLLDFEAERDINFVFTAHYLALLCADGYRSSVRQVQSKLWGNLSWLYEDVGDEEMMRIAADKAAAEYEAIYRETRLTTIQEQITCLSIAGMQYRAGVDRDLKKYLFTAKTIKEGDKTYSKLAEDFMDGMRLAGGID